MLKGPYLTVLISQYIICTETRKVFHCIVESKKTPLTSKNIDKILSFLLHLTRHNLDHIQLIKLQNIRI